MERDLFEIMLFLSLQLETDVKNWRAEVVFDISSSFFLFSQWWISANDS